MRSYAVLAEEAGLVKVKVADVRVGDYTCAFFCETSVLRKERIVERTQNPNSPMVRLCHRWGKQEIPANLLSPSGHFFNAGEDSYTTHAEAEFWIYPRS